ncbi:uncharacterized protein LOC105915227 isoform X1 [Fundulus heteroclitus]|uniref:uncharacterized protein LOC105915227 isoform X1 n=1 Tax=Fundulus heteroclitus TaxID=8078 RepID=UPI00165C66F6|nr:uncharacterized protein LOC105915227 isoform X1 [Fundulus heteroclitus]
MAAAPLGLAPERCWTEEKERTLIAFFSRNSCLWNHKSENYKNRELRWKTLDHLRILLSSQPPPVAFTVEDIKNKFKNLRTTFQRQYKMVRASGAEGFVPQWKHYQQLTFLQGCFDPEDGADAPLAVPKEEDPFPLPSPGLIISFLPSPPSSSSPCVPSSVAGRCFWSEERERELISFYAEHGCLWNKKSENHNNRQLRQKLLESLRNQLSDQLVSFSVDDIKSKFKNLRTVFNREYKAVQANRTSDKPYVSKWKHYHQMLFLCESFEEDESPDDLQILTVHGGMDPGHPGHPDQGNRTFCSGLSGEALCSSTQSDSPTITCSAYQVFLPADRYAPADHMTPGSPPARKPGRTLGPAEDRVSSESRCLWSEAKVQQLISFYSEHSCLWNHRLDSYRNRLLRRSLLETLSGLLSHDEPAPFTVEDIKTKFRNLRTIFQREHKAVSSNRTCGSEDFYLPKWKHYLDLMFLCDSEDDEPLSPPSHAAHQTAPSPTGPARVLEVPASPTPPDSRLSSSSSSSSSASSSRSRAPGRQRARRRRRASPSAGELMALMRSVHQNRTGSPHAGFLKYVEECLNEAPPDKVRKLKKKIIETIHGMEDG